MKNLLLFLSISFIGASLHAKPLEEISLDASNTLNKIHLKGIDAVCIEEYKKTLEIEYDKSLAKGFSPDYALQEAIHRSDVICFKTGLSPLKDVSSLELIKLNNSDSPKEDLLIISEYYDRLDNDVDATLKRTLGAILLGATNAKNTALIAKNLKQTIKSGKTDRESLYHAVNSAIE
jgi:hypothetical protein